MESFSFRLKQELTKINIWKNSELLISELYGYLLTFSNNKYITESEYNINCLAKILKNLNYNNFNIMVSGRNYIIEIKKFNKFMDIYNFNKLDDLILNSNENVIRAFVRGLFLGKGSINNPKSGYHLDIILENEYYAHKIKDKLLSYGIDFKMLIDKNFILYLKERRKYF